MVNFQFKSPENLQTTQSQRDLRDTTYGIRRIYYIFRKQENKCTLKGLGGATYFFLTQTLKMCLSILVLNKSKSILKPIYQLSYRLKPTSKSEAMFIILSLDILNNDD